VGGTVELSKIEGGSKSCDPSLQERGRGARNSGTVAGNVDALASTPEIGIANRDPSAGLGAEFVIGTEQSRDLRRRNQTVSDGDAIGPEIRSLPSMASPSETSSTGMWPAVAIDGPRLNLEEPVRLTHFFDHVPE